MTKSEAGEEDPGNTPTITRDSAMTDPANKKEDDVKEQKSKNKLFPMENPTHFDIMWLYTSMASIITVTTMTNACINLVNMTAKGHLGSEQLTAGVGVGDCIATYIVQAFANGTGRALDTFAANAYGAGEMRMCGQVLNRGRMFQFVVSVPLVVFVIFFAESLASIFSSDPVVIEAAAQYTIH